MPTRCASFERARDAYERGNVPMDNGELPSVVLNDYFNPLTPRVTQDEALKALDSLDDYARMGTGVDAAGPRETLRRFIEQPR